MKKINLLIIIFLGLSMVASAQIKVNITLDTTNMLTGDQTNCSIRVEHPKNIEVLFPTGLTLGDKIEILDIGTIDTLQSAPTVLLSQHLLITAFDSGQHVIKPMPFAFRSILGETDPKASLAAVWDTIYSKALTLNISTIPIVDTSYVAPIKAIVEEPLTFEDVLPFVVGGGTILALALIGLFIYKRRKAVPVPETPAIVLPPHEIAMTKLTSLEEQELWQHGEVKEYQSELTYIIREYIENRYHVPALESTTSEILDQLYSYEIPNELQRKISDMLNVADLVKFAKATPPEDIHQQIMVDAKSFVSQTKKEEIQLDDDA